MSPRQWLALLLFYTSYLFFGASVFYHVEHQLETDRRAVELQERIEINEILTKHTSPHDKALQHEILVQVSDYCGKKVTNHTTDEYVDPYIWNFYHSFFFSFIVCSTVGYGNISPNNTFGRIFMIFYALIGIPVNGFLFAYLGDFFGKTFIRMYRSYKSYKIQSDQFYSPRKWGLIARIALYLVPGIIFFIFIPACLFTHFEDWDYDVAVYYSFVTLTTIGFGDYVPTFQSHQERTFGLAFIFYETFIILWFISGLGYLVMIMGFIARGLQSKRIARLEHQLSVNLKETQHRIWNGVTKDVSFIRKILNEINMMKYKPVYKDSIDYSNEKMQRSESCPELTIYRVKTPIVLRKRAVSTSVDINVSTNTLSTITFNRVQSDTDLTKINKEKTFGINRLIQPADLLTQVVTALSGFRNEDENQNSLQNGGGGFHGFTDSMILADERSLSRSSFAPSERSYMTIPKRGRAASDVRIPMDDNNDAYEWTWSGANSQIKDIMKVRQSAANPKMNLYKASFLTERPNLPQAAEVFPKPEVEVSATNKSIFSKLFRRRPTVDNIKTANMFNEEMTPQRYLEKTARGRAGSLGNLQHNYLTSTSAGRQSLFVQPEHEDPSRDLLENTTIADLIRALEMAHTHANSGVGGHGSFDQPKRKLGTASLTPPKMPSLLTLFPQQNMSNSRRNSTRSTRRSSVRPPLRQSLSTSGNFPLTQYGDFHFTPNKDPPAYKQTESPKPLKRRFSVRPTNLATPPGQTAASGTSGSNSSLTGGGGSPSTILQRRLSVRPSPLVNSRLRQSQHSNRNPLWRPTQLQQDMQFLTPSRHMSLSNLYERRPDEGDRKRTDSR